MRDYPEFLAHIRACTGKYDGFSKDLRGLISSGGPVLVLAKAFVELQDAYTHLAVREPLTTEESRLKAIGLRGQLMGIDSCLQTLYSLITEDKPDVSQMAESVTQSGSASP